MELEETGILVKTNSNMHTATSTSKSMTLDRFNNNVRNA